MAVTRTIYFTVHWQCCKDREVRYKPEPRSTSTSVTKDKFESSLSERQESATKKIEAQYQKIAVDDCGKKGTSTSPLRPCNFEITNVSVTETGSPEKMPCPGDVIGRVSRIKDLMATAEDVDERMALQQELDRLVRSWEDRGYDCS